MEIIIGEITDLKITAGSTDRILIENFSVKIPSGKMIALTGLNGTGKSTLLYAMAGLRDFHSGKMIIGNKNMNEIPANERSKQVSMVFTSQENIPWMDVYSFVASGRSPYTSFLGKLNDEDKNIIDKVISETNLSNFSSRYISELSDGEKQRCLIARALVQQTPLILLDEPTAFLDIKHKNQILELLRKITSENNVSVVFSSHDVHLAKKYADEIWFIENQKIRFYEPLSFSEEVFL